MFVPLVLDDEKRLIVEKEPISFDDKLPFEEQKDRIKEKIIDEINTL